MSTLRSFIRISCVLLGLLISAGSSLHAQWRNAERAGFLKGDYSLSAGAGIGLNYGFSPAATDRPAFMLMVDRGAIETRPGTIAIGGILAYKAASQNLDAGRYSSAWSCVTAAVRATFHVTPLSDLVPALDAYAGVMGGVQYWHFTDNYSELIGVPHKEQGVRPINAPFIGLKCHLKPGVGLWAEAGWDVAMIKGGLYVDL
jgi:hypothetical protein